MSLRHLTASEWPALTEWIEALQASNFNWNQKTLLEELQVADAWVWDSAGVIKAVVICRHGSSGVDEITLVAVKPEFQGRGLAQKLLTAYIDAHCQQSETWLEVHEKNLGARRVYEKIGFLQSGRRPRYYQDGGDAILYTLKPLR